MPSFNWTSYFDNFMLPIHQLWFDINTLLDETVLHSILQLVCASSGYLVMIWIPSFSTILHILDLKNKINKLKKSSIFSPQWFICYCFKNLNFTLNNCNAKENYLHKIEIMHMIFWMLMIPLNVFSDLSFTLLCDGENSFQFFIFKWFYGLLNFDNFGNFKHFFQNRGICCIPVIFISF